MILHSAANFVFANAKSAQAFLFVGMIVGVWLTERIVLA